MGTHAGAPPQQGAFRPILRETTLCDGWAAVMSLQLLSAGEGTRAESQQPCSFPPVLQMP